MSEPKQPPSIEQRFLPRGRESFFDAQRRNRRATWRLSALCVLAAVVMGIPLALIVTPLLYAVTLIAADVISLFSPLPSSFWQRANEVARFGFVAVQWLLEHQAANPQALAIGAAVMLLPGTVLSIVLWLGMNTLFRHGGVGGALLALKAREPNQSDLKELQLADTVQEMAIAAGLPAPRVMLIDAPGANAAAIGTSPEDARVLLSRRLVDDLSRDELEGVLAHLIASISNGDLRIAFRVAAIFETCGLLVTVINSPFGSLSRRTLWRIARYGLVGSRKEDSAQEAAAVADILSRGVALDTDDIDRMFDTTGKKSLFRSIRNFILFPIFFTNAAIKLSLWFFSLAVLGPSISLLLRTRRYLADASAVQLTRNPDGLASALQKLSEDDTVIPGGSWASHLCIVSPGRGKNGNSSGPNPQQQELLARAWAASGQTERSSPLSQTSEPGFANALREFTAVQRAALSGDAQALERLRAARQALEGLDPSLAAQIPDPADLLGARHGDRAAIARLRAIHGQQSAGGSLPAEEDVASGASSNSFLGSHPSLRRRLKRLDRMGAHADLAAADRKMWIVAATVSLILGPFVLAAVALLLLLIAVMTMASLTFLVVWLAFIHKAFTFFGHR
jgi:Zn-dependent protease with chaperone function